MPYRLHWAQANRTYDVTPRVGDKLYVRVNGTDTQTAVVDANGAAIEQPIPSDSTGTFLPHPYRATAELVRVLVTDADDVARPGYPIDDVALDGTDFGGASTVAFDPIESNAATNVQTAIANATALALNQSGTLTRTLTAWTTGGASNAYTLTPSPAIVANATGVGFNVQWDRANTGAATINVNGLGAVALRKVDRANTAVALISGDIQPGDTDVIVYNGTYYIIPERDERATAGVETCYRTRAGRQSCRGTITLTRTDADTLSATLTFSRAFSGTPIVALTLAAAGVYTNVTTLDIGPPFSGTGSSALTVGFKRMSGSTFPVGASVTLVRYTAEGDWF